MLPKRFCELVGCDQPLQLAGMGHIAGIELAAAVTNAGGLGMIAMPMVPADPLRNILEELRQAADGPVGVNFLMPFLDAACVEVAARSAHVVEWSFATPDRALVELVHRYRAIAGWQVGSLADACRAVEAGCDYVVVQGIEAGGHVCGRQSLWHLLAEARDHIDVPIVAAGGLANATSIAAAFTGGADAVRIGTRFVAATEADAHRDYVQSLIGASAADTELTTAFGTMWPDAPHRVLRSAIRAATESTVETIGEVTLAGNTIAVPRLSPIAATKNFNGSVAAMPLYAGHSVDSVTRTQPAAEIVAELIDEAARLLTP